MRTDNLTLKTPHPLIHAIYKRRDDNEEGDIFIGLMLIHTPNPPVKLEDES